MYKDEKAKVYLIFFCKKFYCFRLIQCMGEGSRVVKMIPSGCRKKLRQKPDTREMQRAPQKPLGSKGFLVMLCLRVNLSKRYMPQPGGQPACGF